MCRQISWEKKSPVGGQVGDVVSALFFATYPYGGFEQPFYVLAEVKSPQKTFPRAVIFATAALAVLFPLVNVSYLCVTPFTGDAPSSMVLSLFQRISNSNSSRDSRNIDEDSKLGLKSTRAVSAIIALSIFGNLMAQTFTATRVKQEIAKEGILPWSLEIATGSNTVLPKLFSRKHQSYKPTMEHVDDHAEQVPIAATFLHWLIAVTFVLIIGAPLPHTTAYRLLTYFKVFAILITLGSFTVWGLLYLKIDSWVRGPRGRRWYRNVKWKPWLDPLHVVVASLALGFLLFATFAKPSNADQKTPPWWVGPMAGWAITVGSVGWWLGLRFAQWRGRWTLRRQRIPYVEVNEFGEAVQKAEIVECERIPVSWAGQIR
jgi:amino acid transporter